MHIQFLLDLFQSHKERDAVVWQDQVYSYEQLLQNILNWKEQIPKEGIEEGAVVSIQADFSPNSIALLLALIDHSCVVVPLSDTVINHKQEFLEIAQVTCDIVIDEKDTPVFHHFERTSSHDFYEQLRERKHPGLVLFSSGSTGKSKGAVHDLNPLLEKFKTPRHALRSISFLLYDHIGGFNTLLYNLSNTGVIVTVADRSADTVLAAIEKYQVELLPTSPTFINLILLSEAYQRHDISCLKLVTYGTEPMPQSTLETFHKLYPDIRLLQTYGLSELGILRSKSKDSGSLWVKIGGEGFETRVVDGILHIKAHSAMLGYLNAPSPFTEDGWFNTQDMVEVDGEYFRIHGRKSEIINVGGQKVYPVEVESVLLELDGVDEALVYGESNPITGNIVCARINPAAGIDLSDLKKQVKIHCRERMANFKVPVRIKISEDRQYSDRFKKQRVQSSADNS